MRMGVQELIDKVKSYNPSADEQLICRAYEFAQKAHAGQMRESGEPFFEHPREVAMILAELEMDTVTVCAGLLHDVVEDTEVTAGQVAREFGDEIALLVEGVTKLTNMPFQTRQEHQVQNLRKMFLAMAEDLRVVLIKLADRLHNMRTLRHLSPERQKRLAEETLEIYTPLAHRLGIWSLKWEMEDLALRYLDPEAYYQLRHLVAKQRQVRETEIAQVIAQLQEKLAEVNIKAHITGRPKHFYSIYQKMHNQGKKFEEIYDLLAVRVIVDTVKDCYGVLGIVHTLWKPVPGRFKDYIAMPKSNMYQSLHTTVIGPKGDPFEVQIRTWEMHRIAEKGIAAHWLYKEGYPKRSQEFEEKVAWLRQVMEWLREMKEPEEFMATLKIDLFEDEVFVFTPKGDVKNLAAGSTPVDFAFSVHSDIGLRCVGAKVNGRIVPLDYELKNGDIVEILTAKNASPSQDWLGFVKTSKARSKIRAFLREQHQEESVAKGRAMLEREARKAGVELSEVLQPEALVTAAHRYGYAESDDLLAAIGFGKILPRQVLHKIIGEEEPTDRKGGLQVTQPAQKRRGDRGVSVKGVDNLLVRMSKCCSPVPGDEIVGYITRGRGVSIHRKDCPNLQSLPPERAIEVEWSVDDSQDYPVDIEIEAIDRTNLLANIVSTVNDAKAGIGAVNARTTKDRLANISLTVNISDLNKLHDLIRKLRHVDGVLSVQRARPT